MDHFDPYSVFLVFATNMPVLLLTGFVVGVTNVNVGYSVMSKCNKTVDWILGFGFSTHIGLHRPP